MKRFLRATKITVVLGSCIITLAYEIKHPELIPVFLAGIITRDFFTKDVFDPIFTNKKGAHTWLYEHAYMWATRQHPSFSPETCKLCRKTRYD